MFYDLDRKIVPRRILFSYIDSRVRFEHENNAKKFAEELSKKFSKSISDVKCVSIPSYNGSGYGIEFFFKFEDDDEFRKIASNGFKDLKEKFIDMPGGVDWDCRDHILEILGINAFIKEQEEIR